MTGAYGTGSPEASGRMTESRTLVHVSPSVMGRIRTSSRIRHSAAPADTTVKVEGSTALRP